MLDSELDEVLRAIGDLGLDEDEQDAERRVLGRLNEAIPALTAPGHAAERTRRHWLNAPRRRTVAVGGLVALMLGAGGVASALLGHGSSTELVYEAVATPQHPVTRASLEQTVRVMRERLRGSAPRATVRLTGREISVNLPGASPTSPIALEVGATAGVEFYDWEGSVIDASGKIAGPNEPDVTGGIFAGSANYGVSLYQALMRAAKRPPHHYPTSTTTDGTFYAVQAGHRRVLAGPALTREQLGLQLANAPAASRSSAAVRIVHVRVGTTIVSGETPSPDDGLPDRPIAGSYYVLNDDPALVGADISEAVPSLTDGDRSVQVKLTPAGQASSAQVTKLLAQRGASNTTVGRQPDLQHLAIVLNGGVVSTPAIDFSQCPHGINASAGTQIGGGFTKASVRTLANVLASGPLPVALVRLTQATETS